MSSYVGVIARPLSGGVLGVGVVQEGVSGRK